MPTRLMLPAPSICPPERKNTSMRPCPAQSNSSRPPSVKKLWRRLPSSDTNGRPWPRSRASMAAAAGMGEAAPMAAWRASPIREAMTSASSSSWRKVASGTMRAFDRCGQLPFARLGEELRAVGKAVGLEEEAENDGTVGRHRLVLVARWPPDELARSADALVVFERALEHECLLERGVLVQRHDGAGIELEQRRGDAAVVGIEHLDPDARELGRLPRHVGHVEIARGELRR